MVIVITGPIASGKSTIARELARELERIPERVAVIDLDLLLRNAHPGRTEVRCCELDACAACSSALANIFLEEGVTVVIAEGSFNTPSDRAVFAQHLHTSVGPLYVSLRVSFEERYVGAERPNPGSSRRSRLSGRYTPPSGRRSRLSRRQMS